MNKLVLRVWDENRLLFIVLPIRLGAFGKGEKEVKNVYVKKKLYFCNL